MMRSGSKLILVAVAAVAALTAARQAGSFAISHATADEPVKPATVAAKASDVNFTAEQTAAGTEIFQKQLRVVLAHKCVKCHGGDHTEAKFDLTTRDGLLRGGESGAVIELGKGKESLLYKLAAHEQEPYMPDEGEKMSPDELKQLAAWIDLGAPYDKPLVEPQSDKTPWTERKLAPGADQFWSFKPLRATDLPAVKQPEASRGWIDRYVQAKLDASGIPANSAADRRTLLRRAAFDLVGIGPTADELKAFASDASPDAYERQVDRLLADPRHGERWGRHWLDVARFAESHGFEQDYDRPFAYHFRDFVIEALNRDLPFDDFVRWQLAGDELAPEKPLALKATGFLGAGVFPTQITANEVERTRYDALDDMAATTGTAFLGLTIGCARCHDHKFDPIPQADYYRILATFTTTVRSNIEVPLDPVGAAKAKEQFEREHAPLAAALKRYESGELAASFAAWEKQPTETKPRWTIVTAAEAKSAGGATLAQQADGSLLATGVNPAFDVYTLTFDPPADMKRPITALRIEALADPSMKRSGPGRAENGNFALTDLAVATFIPAGGSNAASAEQPVKLLNPRATFEQAGLPVAAVVDSDAKSAWAVDPQFGKSHAAAFDFAAPVSLAGGARLRITLKFENNTGHNIGRLRVALSSDPGMSLTDDPPAEIAATLVLAPEKRTAQQNAALLNWYKSRDERWQTLNRAVSEHQAKAPKPKTVTMMVCSEGVTPIRHHTQGADFFDRTYFLKRGNCDDKEGVATPGFLQLFVKSPEDWVRWERTPPPGAKTSFRRAALANWMTDAQHGAGQLAARVAVNRLWQHHFGRGIVATPNDFGKQGTPPSHPELLDALALRLIGDGWQLKPLHRAIMTSAAYQRSGELNAAAAKIDPDDLQLWRRTPQRLEAEIVRDAMLAVSGTLDTAMYGPGSLEESQRRRSIYFTIKRSRLIGIMQLFDQPEPLVSVGGRPTTTVAPQALALMNNPQVRSYAKALASRVLSEQHGDLPAAIESAFEQTVVRPMNANESHAAQAFVAAQQAAYAAAGDKDANQLALADWCQALFALNEFIYID